MSDNDVWPPKPNLADPQTEWDELITAKLNGFAKSDPGDKRFRLILVLRVEKGLGLRQAVSIVNSYCDRHGILVRNGKDKFFAWCNFGLILPAMLLNFFNIYLSWQRNATFGAPHHHAAVVALHREQLAISYAVFALLFLNIIFLVIRFRRNRQK